jgi:hypothetical protein
MCCGFQGAPSLSNLLVCLMWWLQYYLPCSILPIFVYIRGENSRSLFLVFRVVSEQESINRANFQIGGVVAFHAQKRTQFFGLLISFSST